MSNLTSAEAEELRRILEPFSPDVNSTNSEGWGWKNLSLNEDEADALPPNSVFLVFVVFARFGWLGKGEKVKWSIPMLFKGTPLVIAHQKFGLRIRVSNFESLAPSREELIGRLRGAVKMMDQLIEPFAAEQVRSGNVTFGNRYALFRGMYEFLRARAKDAYSSSPPANEPIVDDKGNPVGWHSMPLKSQFEGFYLAAPALDSYYSWLEHLLALLLPFSHFDVKTDDLVDFLTSSWAQKFKRVFDLSHDREAKRAFDSLLQLKERLRNPIFHGGIEAEGTHTLHFHVRGLGVVPVSLSRFKDSIHYSLIPIRSNSFEEFCRVLDDVDTFLESGPLSLGCRYAKSGLDVSFDEDSVREYARAARSDEEMEEFIEMTAWHYEQAINMDW